ncbi:MAG: transketolase-like TK C-terminal-containing protein, partial [Chloroflexota bacterium]
DKPSLIVVQSTIGYGSPSKAGTGSAHGEALGADEIAGARAALGWEHGPFEVPQEVYDHMRGALERGDRAEREWLERFAEYERTYPEDAASLRRDISGDLPAGWDSGLQPLYEEFSKPTAARSVSGKAIEAISSRADILVGGSADLAGSNKTLVEGRGSFLPESYSGRNLHFGVREHAMGSAANGMAAHGGVIPYTATFLTFSDYMRPALRLAALSGLRVIFIYTHDSLGLGGDGPTHQPVSHMMSLRTIPGLRVIRPADAHETIEAWRVAMERSDGPTVLVFSRQDLPLVDRSRGEPASALARGAYIISDDSDGAGEPDVIIIGTGSEVKVAQEGAALLSADGVKTRVISMPSWDLFDAQPEEYRERVLPSSVHARVAVEAGSPLGWEHYVGLDGATIGVRGYGASAPGEEVLEKFGFTAQNVQSTALNVLERQKKTARSRVVAHPPSGAA